ncbi:hypothetical protein Tco_0618212 [Tanacetum coccineum]
MIPHKNCYLKYQTPNSERRSNDIWDIEDGAITLSTFDHEVWKLLSPLEAHGAASTTEDANHKFSDLCPQHEIKVILKHLKCQNVCFVSQSKGSTNKVKSGFSGAYSSCTPSTSSTNIPEKEVLAGFADEVIYPLFRNIRGWDCTSMRYEQN